MYPFSIYSYYYRIEEKWLVVKKVFRSFQLNLTGVPAGPLGLRMAPTVSMQILE